jgi:sec-independent protein translocase protein TatA
MNIFAFLWDSSPTAIILILVVVVLLFGANKIPELARGIGKAKREFKRASDEIEDEVRSAVEEDDRKKEIEKEERAKIRAKLEKEERAKLEKADKSDAAPAPDKSDTQTA